MPRELEARQTGGLPGSRSRQLLVLLHVGLI